MAVEVDKKGGGETKNEREEREQIAPKDWDELSCGETFGTR